MSKKEIVAMLHEKYGALQLTKTQAANELNISNNTIDNMRKRGEITGKKVSAQIMFTLAEIADHVGE